MPYCFLSFSRGSDGRGLVPECPKGVRWLLLAAVRDQDWGLFEVTPRDDWSPPEPVDDALARLIDSAKRYPPALALARDEMDDVFSGASPERSQLARAYGTALRVHMGKQHEAPFVMAKALRSEPDVMREGEWYWVLSVSGSPVRASYVSDDFQEYKTDMGAFDLTGQQLKRLGYAG